MFRLQPPLPDDYSTATADELARRVVVARARLGKRLVILGHHYQREEVIQFADMRGGLLRSFPFRRRTPRRRVRRVLRGAFHGRVS